MVTTLRSDKKHMTKDLLREMVLTAVNETGGAPHSHTGTLMQFHARLGHFSFDSIKRMAKEPQIRASPSPATSAPNASPVLKVKALVLLNRSKT